MTNINIEAVINDLAEQVKKLTVDNAVLRAALQSAQQHDHPVPPAPPVVEEAQSDAP